MFKSTKYSFILFLLTAIFIIPVLAATITISPDNMNGWFSAAETGDAAPAQFVFGPGNPPAGAGSARFVLDDGGDGVILVTSLVGVRLDEFTTMNYSTYVTQNTGVQTIALQFNIDFDLTDANSSWQGRMVYEPYYDNSVLTGQWQTWDALAGRWWFTGLPGRANCPISSPCSVATILSLYPNIGVQANPNLGAVLFKAGSGWTVFDGNVDALTLGINGIDTTYDFEPGTASCRNGGWQSLGFRNQGQCISAIVSNSGGN